MSRRGTDTMRRLPMPRVERICLLTKPARSRPESRAALPRWVKPQLCQLVKTAPDGPEWLHEIKFDRYRMHARIDRGRAELLTRTGLDWTGKYPAAAAALAALPAKTVYLDGELCGVRPDGTTSFDMIQVASEQGNAAALVFFAFDLLFLDGEDLTVAAAEPAGDQDDAACCAAAEDQPFRHAAAPVAHALGAPRAGCPGQFLAWTDQGLLRQVVYQGQRQDKPARDVRRPGR